MCKHHFTLLLSVLCLTCAVPSTGFEMLSADLLQRRFDRGDQSPDVSWEDRALAKDVSVVNWQAQRQEQRLLATEREQSQTSEKIQQLSQAVAANADVLDVLRGDIASNWIAIVAVDKARTEAAEVSAMLSAAIVKSEGRIGALEGVLDETQNALCPIYDAMRLTPRPAFCPEAPRILFLSSLTYSGDLGGVSGANASCQALADEAGLAGDFKAWLSDNSGLAPENDFIPSDARYELVDGTLIADDWDDLTDGTIAAPIYLDETGAQPPLDSDYEGWSVWTATTPNGEAIPPNPLLSGFCTSVADGAWTTDNSSGDTTQFGGGTFIPANAAGEQDGAWSTLSVFPCEYEAHLYCVEQ
jgi:hypothetical protein